MDHLPFLKSSCQVQRTGKIIRLEEQAAIIFVNGKNIAVPFEKVEADILPGQEVVWTGSKWSRILTK
ncbi:hypothetical protein [Paenibacillus sp. sgz302251]|uniref:hypothetical protein n=1 Tax=Paenibacillus sp. sgz302251 TaxID=3414493 RepID=UPI003C7A0B24